MIRLLIIDDESEMLNGLHKIFMQNGGYQVELLEQADQAIKRIQQQTFDIILCDLFLKEASGLDVLKASRTYAPGVPVIMISGYGTIDSSVQAMREGAFDFLEKPFTSKRLFECLERAIHTLKQKKGSVKLNGIQGIVYQSRQMAGIIEIVKKVAPENMNILITGESGTGKELIARAMHAISKREKHPFIPVNCGALPAQLFESELFGHEKGAFTGAIKTKPGLLEFANQGTFFFDEIGELSLPLQVKLLRMLEERKIRRVGGEKEIDVDIRIIAATNKNLEQRVRENKFREDLFYRLNIIHIDIPPLRERKEDILPLAHYFLNDLNMKNSKQIVGFSPDTEETMRLYSWPGNAREMHNLISRAYFLSSSSTIEVEDFPLPTLTPSFQVNSKMLNLSFSEAKEVVLKKFEIEYLKYHLKRNEGNITKTAEDCGLDRRSIHRILKKYNFFYKK
jgi:two-component system response regulator HydG